MADPAISSSAAQQVSREHILVERRGPVLWVTFNRPQARNSMTLAMYERLYELCAQIDSDSEIRCAVFTGAGDRAFVAGTDINEFTKMRDADDVLSYEERMDRVFARLEDVRVPIVAAIRGACTGGGFGIASGCDLRIAGPSARFGFPVARTLGNCLSMNNYRRLERLLGQTAVKQMIYTADLFNAKRMYELGYINEVTERDDEAVPRAEAVAVQIAGNAPLTIATTKEALRRIVRGTPGDDHELVQRCYLSDDFREGMTAFLEKRPANWKGR